MLGKVRLTRFSLNIRGWSFLSPDTRLECFLRGAKFLAKNLRGLKGVKQGVQNFPVPERIRGVKFSSARENKGYDIFQRE